MTFDHFFFLRKNFSIIQLEVNFDFLDCLSESSILFLDYTIRNGQKKII